ncbi:SGNH/GDSL hydrolase family protein [Mesorhizobium sp. KR9-304]|uniref:SGNH/GDSL hydrolase family protein n=1 Tax=Mesorhizobium sp. KR9-304 TaxID=3156614 RepID=UPI0032B4BDD8
MTSASFRPSPKQSEPATPGQLSSTRKFVYWIISVFVSVVALVAVLEVGSYFLLKSQGIQSALFLRSEDETVLGRDQFREAYRTLDPHLAFTYGKNSEKLLEVQKTNRWIDGFLLESPAQRGLRKPIILALGGSTTDGVKFPGSWPEQLAKILDEHNIQATVINGGIGGYTTSQDLFKLIRDGFEFQPDIVIEYGGVNDGWRYSVSNHLMVHPYQESILKVATGQDIPRILPSAMTLARQYLPMKGSIDYSLGVGSKRTRAQTFKKNMEIMQAATISQGGQFYAVIQPFSFYQSKHASPNPQSVGLEFISGVTELYNEILFLTNTRDYIHDATQALEGATEVVYQPDGVHLNSAGNKIIAEYMFNLIKDPLTQAPPN